MFDGIEEFIAVANHLSFKKAATAKGVSSAHISRKVAALEKRLNVRLVSRTTRVVQLTASGQQLYSRCLHMVDDLQREFDSLANTSQKFEGSIRISAAGDFTERFLAPIIAQFAKAHPDVSVYIDFNPSYVDLVSEKYDFAVRYGFLPSSSNIAIKLIERALVFACSPKYLQAHGKPTQIEDLHQHRCMTSNALHWLYHEPGDTAQTVKRIAIKPIWRSNSSTSLIAAAKEDNGIIYLPESTLADELNSGELVSILDEYAIAHMPSWIMYPKREYQPKRVTALIAFIREQLKQQWPLSPV